MLGERQHTGRAGLWKLNITMVRAQDISRQECKGSVFFFYSEMKETAEGL